jgi:glycosyltransferase involved in cell wall biosynthesis
LNILYITQFFSDSTGGGESVISNLAKEMIYKGHFVYVVCHDTMEKIAPHPGLQMTYVKPCVTHSGGLPPSFRQNALYMINAITKGIVIAKKNEIDVIHANSHSSIIPGTVISKIFNIPILSTIHDVFSFNSTSRWDKWAEQHNLSKLYTIIGPLFEKANIRMPVNMIHAVSKATKDEILGINPSANIVVIPNAISSENSSRTDLSFDKFVLFIGRLVFYKNLEIVIMAFRLVLNEVPAAKLFIIGDGPMRSKWEGLVINYRLSQNVIFLGRVSTEKKNEMLRRCSALVFPSIHEGFGLVVLESFSMGKPVIAASVRPLDEIIRDGVDGYLVPPDRPREWAEKMIELLKQTAVSKNMGLRGREKTLSEYNVNRVINDMENLYGSLIKKRS